MSGLLPLSGGDWIPLRIRFILCLTVQYHHYDLPTNAGSLRQETEVGCLQLAVVLVFCIAASVVEAGKGGPLLGPK